ncbi:pyridoxamine 5'-phosphate oxidase family protein [Nitrospira sp. NS4]|uniref:pyridoxamine 5'-phosphate oxidase family protein n=1 Tax=Nitrospira sp. NS4 TaxID=3414498 RepID=UPI003C2F667A
MKRPASSGEQQAQRQFGTGARAAAFYANQMLDHLNQPMQEFIARQEMLFVATSSASGDCDCSFRAGAPGFVQVLDGKTLAYPEYRGNGVLASLGNILENPHIGLIFLDFFRSTVGLHVNGAARVCTREQAQALPHLSARLRESGHLSDERRADAWILIDVEEAYIHCSKHVPLLKLLDKGILWGTDDEHAKGGDFFKVKREPGA